MPHRVGLDGRSEMLRDKANNMEMGVPQRDPGVNPSMAWVRLLWAGLNK